MKLKNKKMILPIAIILLLIFSILSPLSLAWISEEPQPAWYHPEVERERERTQNATYAWNISEHFRDGTVDENWNVSYFLNETGKAFGTPWMMNDTIWNLDAYPGYTFGYSFMWNNSTGTNDTNPFHWAIVNNSYFNRTQSLVFARAQNWTIDGDGEIYYGYIFKANNSSNTGSGIVDNMTAVLYGPKKCYVLSYNNTTGTVYDTKNGTIVTSNASDGLTNYYNNWFQNQSDYGEDYYNAGFYNGTWIKTIYNSHCGYLQSKYWGNTTDPLLRIGLLDEPTGWIIDGHLPNISTNDSVMVGLAVWNPNGCQAVVQFDTFDVWRLNYTRNNSVDWVVAEGGRPHMNFPINNASSINSSLVTLFWEAISGNLTMDNITDFWISLTNNMSMESRPYYPDPNTAAHANADEELQNDTVYYYSAIISNANAFFEYWFGENPFIGNPDDLLWLWVHDCPQKFNDITGLNFLFISVDIDNDGNYDPWDRAFLCSDLVWGSWTGLTPDVAPNYWYNDTYDTRGIQNLHRYNQHLYYNVMIPLTEFNHHYNDSQDYLGVNDTFGLNIVTSNQMWDEKVCFWQNYNESNCSTHVNEDPAISKPFYVNATYLEHGLPLTITEENVGRWGEGYIPWNPNEPLRGSFTLTILKSANVTDINTGINTITPHIINYSINVSNTNTGTLTNIQINDTWFNCSCNDYDWIWLNQTWNNTNSGDEWRANTTTIWWNNDSCYFLINITDLDDNEWFNISFNIDARVCVNTTRGIMTNTATGTCDQTGVTDSDTHSVTWATTERLRIQAQASVFDVIETANSVIAVLGIVLIIGAILAIVGVVYNYVR